MTIICVFLLLAGGIFTKHNDVQCESEHLTVIKTHGIDCSHDDFACFECIDNANLNASKNSTRPVSVNKKNVFRKKTTYKYSTLENGIFKVKIPYANSTEPPGSLVIHRFLASVIILR